MWRRIIVVFVFHNWIVIYHQIFIQSILDKDIRHWMIKTKVKIKIEFLLKIRIVLKIKIDDIKIIANEILHYFLSIFLDHVHFAIEKIYSRKRFLNFYLCLWNDLLESRRFHMSSHHNDNNNYKSETKMFHDFDNLKCIFVA